MVSLRQCSHVPSAPLQVAPLLRFSSTIPRPSSSAPYVFNCERRLGILTGAWTSIASPASKRGLVFGNNRVRKRNGVAEPNVLFAWKSSSAAEDADVRRILLDVNGAGLTHCNLEKDKTIRGGENAGTFVGQVVDEILETADSASNDSGEEVSSSGSPQLISKEVARRRNFAIISHPDAGKTTLTEKLLLFGGAIHEAGAVKARRASRHATSDWMELEKQRGISITSTALVFETKGFQINLLDTPGHQDFGEDTFRTLAAADNAVILVDGGKGLEPQTMKLFEVKPDSCSNLTINRRDF